MPHMYSLTKLTGRRKNVDRTVIVATVEVNRFTFLVVLLSVAASLPIVLLVVILAGKYAAAATIVPFIFVLAGLFLFDQRSKNGLQMRRYSALLDARKAKGNRGTVYVCGEPLIRPRLINLVQSTVPNPALNEPTVVGIGVADKSVTRNTTSKRSFLE